MTNSNTVGTDTATRETTYVCGGCLIKAEYGEGNPNSMKNLPGDWYYIGHEWDDSESNDCGECEAVGIGACSLADRESSPWWECPGCDVTGIMFNDMYLLELIA